jgi:hypothetical protein
MRLPRLCPVYLLLLSACGSGSTTPEPGAILLQIQCAPGAPVPEEFRVWVYDDTGPLWDGARVPSEGNLAAKSAQDLGSVLIQPGAVQGRLRIHVQGLVAGVRVSDGNLIVESLSGSRILDLTMDSALVLDLDADGVPDVIDDCPSMPNPRQAGCPPAAPADAGTGATSPPDAVVASTQPVEDASSDGQSSGSDEAGAHGLDGPSGQDGRSVGLDGAELDVRADTAMSTATEAGSDAWHPPADAAFLGTEVWAPEVDAPSRGADSPAVVGDALLPGADLPADRERDSGPKLDPGVDAVGDGALESLEDLRTNSDTAAVGDTAGGGLAPEVGPEISPDLGSDTVAEEGCGDASVCNLPQGSLCSTDTECASGSCADGVCCTNGCVGPCRSCNQPNADGVCQAYASGTDPEGECLGGTCNGAGACGSTLPSDRGNGDLCTSPGQCSSGFCTDGVCCNSACRDPCRTCGSGTCNTVQSSVDLPECSDGRTCNKKGICVGR